MAETARAFYLQLYFDVWDDPLVAKLRATWKVALMAMLIRAVKSEEPGVILLSIPALAVALNMREATCNDMLDELEARRLIGFRKGDNAIIIARRLLPQLSDGADIGLNTPPRQKTPEQRAAAAERQRKSRQRRGVSRPKAEEELNDVAEPEAGDTSPLLAFFADCPPVVEPPVMPNMAQVEAQPEPQANGESVTEANVTPVTEPVVTADEQPNRVKEHYNTLPVACDTSCDKPKEKCEGVCDFLIVECLVNPKDAEEAAAWLPSLEEAKAYAFWAGEVRKHKPKPGGTLAGLLASLLREKKPIPPEYRTAYRQAQQEAERAAKAAEKARQAQEAQQAQADAHKIRLFTLEQFRQGMEPDALTQFEADALKRVRKTNQFAAERLAKDRNHASYQALWQEAQLAEVAVWPRVAQESQENTE